MKHILLGASALVTVCMVSSATAASPDFSKELNGESARSTSSATASETQGPNTFGEYRLLPNVELKPSGQVQRTDRMGEFGDMAAVRKELPTNEQGAPAQNKVTSGSVLRNQITGEVAQATGALAVLLDGGDISEIASRFGLSIESSSPAVNLYVLKAGEDADLVALRKELLQVEGVEAVKIDVLDNTQQPM